MNHTKKTIPAPGLEAMLASLQSSDSDHPGEGWFSATELGKSAGIYRGTAKKKCDRLVETGVYESCRRKVGRCNITFYRLKKVPGKCSTKANHVRLVQGSPLAHSPAGKVKHGRK